MYSELNFQEHNMFHPPFPVAPRLAKARIHDALLVEGASTGFI